MLHQRVLAALTWAKQSYFTLFSLLPPHKPLCSCLCCLIMIKVVLAPPEPACPSAGSSLDSARGGFHGVLKLELMANAQELSSSRELSICLNILITGVFKGAEFQSQRHS